ncbi:MAG: transporter [Paenibacillaceae bacterium]|jgi:PPP family 3-phenylpropionic acid transporter|nr:transporter [Paenibacillaceae bacterium]
MQRPDFTLRAGTYIFYMTMAVVLPYFPIYFRSLGYSNLQLGLLYSSGPMIGIFAALLWGVWSDKYQTIKKLLIVIFSSQLLILFFIGQTRLFGLMLLIMLGFHFFQSAVIPLNDSMILLHIRRRGGTYASYRVWASIGFASTVFLFGSMAEYFGPGSALWLCGGSIMLSLLLSFSLEERKAALSSPDWSELKNIAGSRRLLFFLASVFVLAVGHRMNDAFVPLVVKDIGGSDRLVGLAQLVAGGCEIPVFLLLAKYGRSFRESTLLIAASLVYVVRFIWMSATTDIVAIIALQTLHSLSFCIYLYASVSMLQKLVPERFRSTGQAMFAFVWAGLAGLTAGALGGYVMDFAGAKWLYRTAAMFAFLGLTGFSVMLWSANSNFWRDKHLARPIATGYGEHSGGPTRSTDRF